MQMHPHPFIPLPCVGHSWDTNRQNPSKQETRQLLRIIYSKPVLTRFCLDALSAPCDCEKVPAITTRLHGYTGPEFSMALFTR